MKKDQFKPGHLKHSEFECKVSEKTKISLRRAGGAVSSMKKLKPVVLVWKNKD